MGTTGMRGLAGILFSLAVVAWFWAETPDLVRVAPAGFKCWQSGLRTQPGLYEDMVGLARFAEGAAPPEAFEAEVTRGRLAGVSGPEWAAVFDAVLGAAGRAAEDLPAAIARRVAEREEGHVAALFYAADEPPFDGLAALPEPGAVVYLRRDDAPRSEPIQVLRVPAGVEGGPVTGCRWYYARWTVAESFLLPWRGRAPWLLAAAVLAFLWPAIGRAAAGLRETPSRDRRLFNGRKRSARIAIGVAAAIAAGLAATAAVQGHDIAPPVAFVGGFLLLCAGITAVMLARSAGRVDRMLAGEGVIARWEYDALEWPECVRTAVGEETAAKWALLGLVGVIMLVVGGVFVAVMQDAASLIVVGGLAGVFGICLALVLVLPGRRLKSLLARPGAVLVARDGIVFGGEIHDFRMAMTRLDGAEVTRAKGRVLLNATYSYWGRAGRVYQTVVIPVPRAHADDAERAADALNAAAG